MFGRGMENIFGMMGRFIKGCGRMDWCMDKAWSYTRIIVIWKECGTKE